MAAIQRPDPMDPLRQVQPRNGFPVQNMGGLPRAGTVAPPKPFMTQPTVAAGPPGPAPMGGLAVPPPRMPAGPFQSAAAPGPEPAQGVGVPLPSPTPPAPAPAAAQPAAPTPTPAPPPGSSATTASSGQSGVLSQPAQGDLEGQIRDYLSGAFKGSVSPDFIQRAKEQVFRNVGGQTKAATGRINDDAIRRGLYKSGIPAEGIANVEAAGQGAMASGISDILNSAEAQNIQGRQAAAGTAGDLLGANRSWQQYQEQAAAAAAARNAANAPQTFQWDDPENPGQIYTLDASWFQ